MANFYETFVKNFKSFSILFRSELNEDEKKNAHVHVQHAFEKQSN